MCHLLLISVHPLTGSHASTFIISAAQFQSSHDRGHHRSIGIHPSPHLQHLQLNTDHPLANHYRHSICSLTRSPTIKVVSCPHYHNCGIKSSHLPLVIPIQNQQLSLILLRILEFYIKNLLSLAPTWISYGVNLIDAYNEGPDNPPSPT